MSNKKRNAVFAVVATLFACMELYSPAQAWDATGHILVAQVAYNNLTAVAKQDVDYLINHTNFKFDFPQFTPYAYSAPWPDYLKYNLKVPEGDTKGAYNLLSNEAAQWHYDNIPYVVGDYHPPKKSVNNSVWAIQYLIPQLVKFVQEKEYNQAAYTLVFITHIVGDMHQPMHNVNLYDSDFPYGDTSGNSYRIKDSFGVSELHALWDESLGSYNGWSHYSPNAGYRPPQNKLEMTANQIQSMCDPTPLVDPAKWAEESHQIAVNFSYPFHNKIAPQLNGKVSASYLTYGRSIAANQICLAGKRLALILNKVFAKPLIIEH